MKTNMINKKVKEIIRQDLMDCEGKYGCDLHHELFNTKHHYIYTSEAKKALNQIDVFKAISIVIDYENDQFGENYTKI